MAEEARESNANWKKRMLTTKLQKRCERLQWSVEQGKDQKRKTTQTKKSREGKVVEMLLSF